MTISTAQNIQVFRDSNFTDPGMIIGKASVGIDNETKKVTVIIESVGDSLFDFMTMGSVQALGLNAFVNLVRPEKVEEFHAKYDAKPEVEDVDPVVCAVCREEIVVGDRFFEVKTNKGIRESRGYVKGSDYRDTPVSYIHFRHILKQN